MEAFAVPIGSSSVRALSRHPSATATVSCFESWRTSSRALFGAGRQALAGTIGAVTFSLTRLVRARRARRPRVPRRGWGDDVKFFDGSVKSNVEAANGLRLITLEEWRFLGACAVDHGRGEKLVDVPSNDWITGSSTGDVLKAWEEADVNQVSLFATGSGVAPMRAVIESKALAGKACRMYYGAREESSMAYADRFDEWRRAGVEIVPVLSQGTYSAQLLICLRPQKNSIGCV
eukprot:g14140.t1